MDSGGRKNAYVVPQIAEKNTPPDSALTVTQKTKCPKGRASCMTDKQLIMC
jgi:hypothetical protein